MVVSSLDCVVWHVFSKHDNHSFQCVATKLWPTGNGLLDITLKVPYWMFLCYWIGLVQKNIECGYEQTSSWNITVPINIKVWRRQHKSQTIFKTAKLKREQRFCYMFVGNSHQTVVKVLYYDQGPFFLDVNTTAKAGTISRNTKFRFCTKGYYTLL